jgi:uncharacterized protein YjiS (DUF1127 family)
MHAILLKCRGRARQRYFLEELDDRLLADIGMSRAERDIEIAKRPWRP